MARRKPPTSDEIELLKPVRRYEMFRRMRGYIERHIAQRADDGASEMELKFIQRDLAELNRIIGDDYRFPLDTPERGPEQPQPEQPLAPPGHEAWMTAFIDWLLEGEPT